MKNQQNPSRAVFATRIGAIATTVGSAVGLGNIWRFPYEAGIHGGGAFLLLYIAFIIILGIPVLSAEFALGKITHKGVSGAFRTLRPGTPWRHFGIIAVICGIMILSFYSVVAGWTLEYTYEAAVGSLSDNEMSLHTAFDDFTSGWRPIMWTLLFLALNYTVISRGVQKGIERFSNILTPILFLLIIAFCINSLMLPGAEEGLKFLFSPDFSKITPQVVIGALGQAFFSLSLGMGTMLTYASYFNERTQVARNATITAALDTLIAIMAGVLIFPAVFTFSIEPAEGPRLVFEVLPVVFSKLPGGDIWGVLFFFMLFLASLTSTISMCEIIVAWLIEERKMRRSQASILTIAIAMLLGILCALSFSILPGIRLPFIGEPNVFRWFDYTSSNILLPLGGLLISVFTGWILDRRIVAHALTDRNSRRAHLACRLIIFSLRWVAPPMIAIIFILNL